MDNENRINNTNNTTGSDVNFTMSGNPYSPDEKQNQTTASTQYNGQTQYSGQTQYNANGNPQNYNPYSGSQAGNNTAYNNGNTAHTNPYNNPYSQPYMNMAGGPNNSHKQPKQKRPKNKKQGGFGPFVGKTVAAALIFGLVGGGVFTGVSYVGTRALPTSSSSAKLTNASSSAKQTSTSGSATDIPDVSSIVEDVMPSIVAITNTGTVTYNSFFGKQSQQSQSCGSGIIVSEDDDYLYIATNNHVVADSEELTVQFNDDSVVKAEIRGTDPDDDLAVVRVKKSDMGSDTYSAIKIATIGDSASTEVGSPAIAIGNALGYGQSVTTGIVSALNRTVTTQDSTTGETVTNNNLIQTDAAINPGNSGGALLNMKGELIGINSARYASAEVEGMGYAIPVATAQPILDNLMTRETRDVVSEDEAGYLGVSVQDVSEEASSYYGIPSGAYLAAVEENGAAAKAGIKQGDIITKFDGLSISSASELKNTIAYYKEGETVDVTYMRANNGEYEEHTVSVTLAKSEAAAKQNAQQKNSTDGQNSQSGNPKDGLTVPDPDADQSEDQQQDESQYYGNMQDFFNQFFGN